MFSVRMLKDKGKGKRCLIIGGGMSVSRFDFSQLPKDMIIFCINDAKPKDVIIDYLVYRDCCFIDPLKEMSAKGELLQVKNIICFRSTYYSKGLNYKGEYYGYTDSDLSLKEVIKDNDNTGLKGIIIAKRIMNFKKIYLIGFDFKTEMVNGKKQSHFYGDHVGHGKKYYEQNHLDSHYDRLSGMIGEFDRIKDTSNIFNCNKNSALTIFEYAMPY